MIFPFRTSLTRSTRSSFTDDLVKVERPACSQRDPAPVYGWLQILFYIIVTHEETKEK